VACYAINTFRRGYEIEKDKFWTSYAPATALLILIIQRLVTFPIQSEFKEIAAIDPSAALFSTYVAWPFYVLLILLAIPTYLIVHELIFKTENYDVIEPIGNPLLQPMQNQVAQYPPIPVVTALEPLAPIPVVSADAATQNQVPTPDVPHSNVGVQDDTGQPK